MAARAACASRSRCSARAPHRQAAPTSTTMPAARRRAMPWPADQRVRVAGRNHDASDSRFEQRIAARRRTAVMRARLQRDVHRGTAHVVAGFARCAQRHHFGVRPAGLLSVATRELAAVGCEDHAADARVGVRHADALRRARRARGASWPDQWWTERRSCVRSITRSDRAARSRDHIDERIGNCDAIDDGELRAAWQGAGARARRRSSGSAACPRRRHRRAGARD